MPTALIVLLILCLCGATFLPLLGSSVAEIGEMIKEILSLFGL